MDFSSFGRGASLRGLGIRTKLLAALGPLSAASALLLGVLAERAVSAVLVARSAERAGALAAQLAALPDVAENLARGREAALLSRLQAALNAGAAYAAALDGEGRVAAHTDLREKGKRYGGAGPRETSAGPVVEAEAPVWVGAGAPDDEFLASGGRAPRRRAGTVRVALPLAADLETAALMSRRLWVLIALTNLAAFGLLAAFLGRLLRPALRLAAAAERLGAGALGETVPVSSSDELGRLTESFNKMSRDLARVTVSRDQLDAVNAALAENIRELARSNQELEEFAFVASHDLQEPLRRILTYAELTAARSMGRLDADASRHLGFIADSARRLQLLIRALLDLSRAAHGEMERGTVDLGALADRIAAEHEPALSRGGGRVTRDALPALTGDRHLLEVLLRNLLNNALKFRGASAPQVHLSAREEGARWVVSVRDNGIGIAPEHLEKVFQIFQRLHSRAQYPGAGIGLALCRKIVERHGGRIWVESEPGRGTTFHFSIPKRAPAASP